MQKIEDRNVHETGWTTFDSVSVARGGGDLLISYRSGRGYRVPLDYVRSWYSEGPHSSVPARDVDGIELAVTDGGNMLQLTDADGSVYGIAWDVVLMACEPDYEHFGGFTETSRRNAETWLRRVGSFRLEPASGPAEGTK